jgi:hypothetical protein
MPHSSIALSKPVESRIIVLRVHKAILDSDLAELYGVAVRHLNQQVKRNAKRFPGDFFFQLSKKEFNGLRSQFVISNSRRGGRRYLPHAFTEHGAIMAATVLNSPLAIEMSIFVVRAFARMREALATNSKSRFQAGRIGAPTREPRYRNSTTHRSDQRTHDPTCP